MLITKRFFTWLLAAALLAAPVGPARGQNSELPLQQGQNRQQEVRKLIALLQSDADLHAKALACKRLAVFGTAEAVPVLASLLSDPQLAHYARYGLEPIADPAVDRALRDAMDRLEGRLLVGVINSIGNRRDKEAVGKLSRLLGDADADVAAAAAAALGRIGTGRTATILLQALDEAPANRRQAVADACLTCADQLQAAKDNEHAMALYDALRKAPVPKHQVAAATFRAILLRGPSQLDLLGQQLQEDDEQLFGVALHAARVLGGAEVAAKLVQQLDDATPARQAKILLALGDLGQPVGRQAVRQAARDGSPLVRAAALKSLARLGDASDASLLLQAALDSDAAVAEAARQTLLTLPGAAVDQAILARLEQADPSARNVMLGLAGQRRIAGALPLFWKAADDPNAQVRHAAIAALGETVPQEQMGKLLDRLLSPKHTEDREALAQALQLTAMRMTDPEGCAKLLASRMSGAPEGVQLQLLELLQAVGGQTALEAVVSAARSRNEAIQDAATRILGQWMSPDAAPELLELARTLPSQKYRIRAMRGYIRIARQLNVSDAERLAMCRRVIERAERIDEKRLVFDVLRRNPSTDSLALAVELLNQPGLAGSAAATAVSIGEKIVGQQPEAVAKAMQKVLSKARGPQAARARQLLQQASQR